ncbi:MAG: GNAT family N-acetyltransferase [Terracoccus sp.]
MTLPPGRVRRARVDDLATLCDLETEADGRFALVGLAGLVGASAPHVDSFRDGVENGRLFVSTDTDDRAIGFIRIERLDGQAHIEQVSVHPAQAGHRIGAQLMTVAQEWARAQGGDRLTLTTFRDVLWNGPYYERLGWVVLPAEQLGPDLTAARARERRLGLDAAPRQAMVKYLEPEGPRITQRPDGL